jgi:hypothetical protein
MRMLRFVAVAIVLCIGTLTTVFGCSCAVGNAKTAFKRSTAVFLGEIVTTDDEARTTYRVIERFKGPRLSLLQVNGCRGLCSYGCGGAAGSRHVIYAFGSDQLITSMCTRSSPESDSRSDLALLRRRAAWWRSPLSSLRLIAWWRQILVDMRRSQANSALRTWSRNLLHRKCVTISRAAPSG